MGKVKVTAKQGNSTLGRVYDYIVEYMTDNGYAPSVRDICMGVGLKSTSTVYHYLEILVDLGKIEMKELSPRAIKVVGYHFEKDKKLKKEDNHKMGKVFDMEKEIVSEQSKKEICEACKEMLKDCGATEEQLEKFEHDFYTVAKKYLFGGKKKE